MDYLNVGAGIATVAAFGLSLYQHLTARSKAMIEKTKIQSQYQRIQSATYAAIAAGEAADTIVQRSKEPSMTLDEVRSLARIVRAQTMLLVRQLQTEEENLAKWEYGRIIASSVHPSTGHGTGSLNRGDDSREVKDAAAGKQ
jgi:Tfp pilus assembly major pilin PilA